MNGTFHAGTIRFYENYPENYTSLKHIVHNLRHFRESFMEALFD